MARLHEFRDPIHGFVRVDDDERRLVDSRPFQRLRHIHQLATTYLVYPGTTHRRFEHSLGVMELAGRVYDVVTSNLDDSVRGTIRELQKSQSSEYWRGVLRLAALLHDIGHLPFSHAAEKELLPKGYDHERLTRELIRRDPSLLQIWKDWNPPILPEHVARVAVGAQEGEELNRWEGLLHEIIADDAFGVDRMDYLLRDAHHAGVAYGRFDHYRLIDTLRILLEPGTMRPRLGVEAGGLQAAESLLLARYLMYSQVYFHPVRRAYDHHLKEFLTSWLPGGAFETDVASFLKRTDNEVTAAILEAAYDPQKLGHGPARRLVCRKHFRVLYESTPSDPQTFADEFATELRQRVEPSLVFVDSYLQKMSSVDFPVSLRDGRVVSSLQQSQVLQNLPMLALKKVYIAPEEQHEGLSLLSEFRRRRKEKEAS
ncbi:MAG: HD domain-containing protein [Armatimonadetes bacterium]|nr:HD domain-containing protein [Armatimonadota bacterium]